MTKLFLNGIEKKYSSWALWIKNDTGEVYITVTFTSGKKYKKELKYWTIDPYVELTRNTLYDKRKNIVQNIDKVIQVGDEYYLITYQGGNKQYIFKTEDAIISEMKSYDQSDIFNYFKNIAHERVSNAQTKESKIIAENIVNQFDQLISVDRSVLLSYLEGKTKKEDGLSHYIYPFGVNVTQLNAVKKAFSSQLSIIEGPPGTGKTQTILNIISNIIVNGQTCAIVSNNNTAVENVYEKLEKVDLDYLIAKLGNADNKKEFFTNFSYNKPQIKDYDITISDVDLALEKLSNHLKNKNDLALIENEINEIKVELKYLEEWFQSNQDITAFENNSYSYPSIKTADLLAYIRMLQDDPLSISNKLNLMFHYHIFNHKFLNDENKRRSFIYHLQYAYYHSLIKEKDRIRTNLLTSLNSVDFDGLLQDMKDKSLHYLLNYVKEHLPDEAIGITEKNYKSKEYQRFIKCFPVVGSSTHSLVNSIPTGFMFDYVIIDEASQQDIVPGVLCLGCAQNVVVVGDRKQLPHIPVNTKLSPKNELYDCYKYSLLDSVSELFGDQIPCSLLKEHYRCHPKIIQFCNRHFYDNQLIPMKQDEGENALSLIITAKGNHRRKNYNLREIESVLKAKENSGFLNDNTGFIAPYNDQVNLSKELLPDTVVKNTIHKFQGRECDKIIFSTVLDKKAYSQKQIDFVDNASLVNVAVSRAIKEFTLVTGDNVFEGNNNHIAALIRYMKYYSDDSSIYESPVISAFDLLYTEYDKSLEKLQSKLRRKDSKFKSEQIVAVLLREIMSNCLYKNLVWHRQIYLRQLVNKDQFAFTERELAFMKNGASCDFVLYYGEKTPFGVIEVDGGWHDNIKQQERDAIKNVILEKTNIPLLRLATIESGLEDKITSFISNCIHANINK